MPICPCARALGICKNIGIRTCFGSWRAKLWGFHATLHFVASGTNLPAFLLYLRTAFFEAHLLSSYKTWHLCSTKSYNVFKKPSYTIVTPYKMPSCPSQKKTKSGRRSRGQHQVLRRRQSTLAARARFLRAMNTNTLEPYIFAKRLIRQIFIERVEGKIRRTY